MKTIPQTCIQYFSIRKVSVSSLLVIVILFFLNIHSLQASGGTPKYVVTEGVIYVYNDFAFPGNNFSAKALIAGEGQNLLVKDLNDNCRIDPQSGNSCMECSIDIERNSWGGWLLTYGYLPPNSNVRELNFGQYPNCGYDFSKVKKLSFWAKGKNGGEKVEFFFGGLGWSPEANKVQEGIDYPDSTPKISFGVIVMENKWKEYTISLDSANFNLSYISCGFGFVASGGYNSKNITFYIDNIRFIPTSDEPPFNPVVWIPVIVVFVGAFVAGIFKLISIRMERKKSVKAAETNNINKTRDEDE